MKIHKLYLYALSGFIFSLFLFSCNDAAVSPYRPIQFFKKSVMSGIGRSAAVSFVINGKGYVALGRNADKSGQLNDCWEYNPDSDRWTEKATFPGVARVKAIAATVNGKAYVGLGFNLDYFVYSDRNAYLKDFWMYDSVSDSWIRKADFPSFATDGCVSFEYENKIIVGSGFNGYSFTNEFWSYDPEADKWTQLNNFPGFSRFGAVACTNGNHVYFGTGFHTNSQNDWWRFSPSNGNWKKLKSLPVDGRDNAIALTINDRFFVATGMHFAGDLTGGRTFSDILEYNAEHDVWYKRGDIPTGNRANAIAFVIDGTGYIGFGDNDSTVINDLWSFKPE